MNNFSYNYCGQIKKQAEKKSEWTRKFELEVFYVSNK